MAMRYWLGEFFGDNLDLMRQRVSSGRVLL
jgi:hypothetical protein